MCGRYTQTKAEAMLRKRFRYDPPDVEVLPRFNVAPTQDAPVVVGGARRTLELLRWGFEGGFINARAETVDSRRAFREAFRRRRCLVPADGFYEWRTFSDGRKVPIRFVRKDREPFAFAGLYEGRTFTILTTTPNALVSPVHDRMPAMLLPSAEDLWLDEDAAVAAVRASIAPYPAEEMDAYEVSGAVNNVRNDEATLVDGVEPTPPPPEQLSLF